MYFCIRDDDTSYFTAPDELEAAYGEITKCGPVSLAVVPFHRAGDSKGVPEKYRGRWTVHPLHENMDLVQYLRAAVAAGRFEIMLHGYYHDERETRFEFNGGAGLVQRVTDGRKYLQDLLDTKVRVFVAPRNAIGREGLRAISQSGLNLGGTAGIRAGWPLASRDTWRTWLRLRKWRRGGGLGVPWILDLGDHREIAGNPVTPASSFEQNAACFRDALTNNGVFCAATHYWELEASSASLQEPPVGEHLRRLIEMARLDAKIVWRTVGECLEKGPIAG